MYYAIIQPGGIIMGELIRRLLRWIIFIIIVVLLILLIVKLANKNGTAKKTEKVLQSGVKTIKKDTKEFVDTTKNSNKKNKNKTTNTTKNNTTTNNTNTNNTTTTTNNNVQTTQVIDAPDTATSNYLSIILGTIVLSGGAYYIYLNRNVTNN